jgi:DNA-binding NtrC family response regulator
VLIADDQAEVREWVADVLRDLGRSAVETSRADEVLPLVEEMGEALSMVLLDLDFGQDQVGGMEALKRLRAAGHQLPVVILTGKGSVRAAVDALKAGATDFLEKDAHVEDTLAAALSRMDQYAKVVKENQRLRAELRGVKEIVGESEPMRQVLAQIERLGPVPRPVLVLGERGTGKELVARALHDNSPRASGPFVPVNCAAIAEGLLECELFGQEENAFDGAPFKEGRFDRADGGTLFLDEIGNMGTEFQQKILRAIEYKSFERVQGTETIHVDVRVIAATNSDLQEAIREGAFRADLYDRLAFDTVRIPPLRERAQDMAPLARHFAQRFHEEVAGLPLLEFTEGALAAMRAAPWPGNVRELKNFVERLATRVTDPRIEASDVTAFLQPVGGAASDDGDPGVGSFADRVAAFERSLVERAMEASGGNRRQAAEALELSYDQLRRLIAKHEIEAG